MCMSFFPSKCPVMIWFHEIGVTFPPVTYSILWDSMQFFLLCAVLIQVIVYLLLISLMDHVHPFSLFLFSFFLPCSVIPRSSIGVCWKPTFSWWIKTYSEENMCKLEILVKRIYIWGRNIVHGCSHRLLTQALRTQSFTDLLTHICWVPTMCHAPHLVLVRSGVSHIFFGKGAFSFERLF